VSTIITTVNMSEGERLKVLVERAGISLYQLGKEAGVAPNTPYNIVNGKTRLGIKTANAFSSVLAKYLSAGAGDVYAELTGLGEAA
jgi:transcriptional regulator with XRE-family HTH domain